MNDRVKQFALGILLAFCWAATTYGQSRIEQSFNQGWQFYKANNSTFFTEFQNGEPYISSQGQWTEPEIWEEVQLPHTFNREDMQKDRNFFEGKAVYQKTFFVDHQEEKKRTFLKFEGVGAVAQLYVNGAYIGDHKGGYAMFVMEITNSLTYGEENTITLVADNRSRQDVIPINHFLFPVYGGIYRPVKLITTNKTNFVVTDQAAPGIFIRQKNVSSKHADIRVEAKLETRMSTTQQGELRIDIEDQEGKVSESITRKVDISPQGVTYVDETLRLKSPHLWDGVRDPYLYAVHARLLMDGKEIDAVRQPLGIRTVELVAGEGVFLNGKKYSMHGVTRHQDREGLGAALEFQHHQQDMRLMKEMGATTIRLAHYQQAPEMYALADSMGFLVWAEIPFVNRVSYQEDDNAKQQMTELVKQNFNHPSIFIWGVHNEVYSETADQQVPRLSRVLQDLAKTLDPDRYTVSVSGYNVIDRPENLTTDVQGINHYFGWYGGEIGDLADWAEKTAREFPGYKIMLSEYGADGNIDIGRETVEAPEDVIGGKEFPENYQTETHIQQWAIIEKHPIILASYIWNMFEFAVPAWNRGGVNARNLKGLITFDRKRKKDAFFWYKANWNPEPMIHLVGRRDRLRSQRTTKIQVFSNLADVTVRVNGQTYPAKPGVNQRHWVVDQAQLQPGENRIIAEGKDGENILQDEMIWTLEEAQNNSQTPGDTAHSKTSVN